MTVRTEAFVKILLPAILFSAALDGIQILAKQNRQNTPKVEESKSMKKPVTDKRPGTSISGKTF